MCKHCNKMGELMRTEVDIKLKGLHCKKYCKF